MSYQKTTWVGGEEGTEITPARLRNLETQYDEVIAYWEANPFRLLAGEPLAVETAASAPSHGAGRIYYNSTSGELIISDGAEWVKLPLEEV